MPTTIITTPTARRRKKQVPNLPCKIPCPIPHNHLHPTKKPETISNKTHQEGQEENHDECEEGDLRRDGEVVPKGGPGTSGGVEFVVKGLHRSMQAAVVIIKMGEIVRRCHGCSHGRHDDFFVRVVGCFVCSATYRALSLVVYLCVWLGKVWMGTAKKVFCPRNSLC